MSVRECDGDSHLSIFHVPCSLYRREVRPAGESIEGSGQHCEEDQSTGESVQCPVGYCMIFSRTSTIYDTQHLDIIQVPSFKSLDTITVYADVFMVVTGPLASYVLVYLHPISGPFLSIYLNPGSD